MKLKHTAYYFIFHLFLYITHIHSEGFLASTLVKTTSGYSCIEQLKPNDSIISYANPTTITQTINSHSDSFIKITILDTEICCAPNQQFYSYNQQNWVTADQLTITDLLTDYNGNPITINSIEIIRQNCILHALTLKSEHSYCVSHLNVIAHNTGHVIVLSIPKIMSAIAPIIKTFLTTAGTYLGVHFAKKAIHKHKSAYQINHSNNHYPQKEPKDNNNNNDDDDKDKYDTTKYPNGIYKGAKYHHQNSTGVKSASPKNGQALLNKALLVKKSTDTFIAVEENYFVVFYKTMEREFHAHIRTWNQLTDNMKNTLIEQGLVKRSGKIIRHF